MIQIALIRHAPTGWNREGRIQGRTDTELSEAGRAMARAWRVPDALAGFVWVTSTLARTRETAALMGLEPQTADSRLNEMDWGQWTGRTLDELRAVYDAEMAANEARGLDFRPAGGESPREVQARLLAWIAERVTSGRDTGAVTHRGVQRVALSLATGWDFLGKQPLPLDRPDILMLEVDATGQVALGPTGLSLARS
jgi:probable phosphoglycerate mutase